jgi:hypothetical protein
MTIKSKMALELARKKFGENACVCCSGRVFEVLVKKIKHNNTWMPGWYLVKGQGKSWELALRDAGVPIPDAPYFPAKVPAAVPEIDEAEEQFAEALGVGAEGDK